MPPINALQAQAASANEYYFARKIRAVASATYNYVSEKISTLGGAVTDLYRLRTNSAHFILSELHDRARTTNISWVTLMPTMISKASLGWVPSRMYVITGTRHNVMQVADYGEANGDLASRFAFDFTADLVGRKTLMNRLGTESAQEKSLLRKHLINKDPLNEAAGVARRRFRKALANWKSDLSFQNQMTYVGANILGECMLGIPELPMTYIPELREVGEILLDPSLDKNKIKKAAIFLEKLNVDLFNEYQDEVLRANKFIANDLELHEEKDSELSTRDQLLKRKNASLYIVEGNISSTLMAGLAYLNNNPEVKKRLMDEIADYKMRHNLRPDDDINTEDLRQLPYLDCIYFEILRLVASAPVVVRKTSVDTTMSIEDAGKKKTTYNIPAHSILFVPLRSMHHDPRIWRNPEQFDPSRFESADEGAAKELRRKVIAFSAGKRACPAQNGFVEVAFKAILADSLAYKLSLDKPIEQVPPYTMEPYWHQEYFAQISPEDRFNKTAKLGLC